MRLQPRTHTVAACITSGCSLYHIRLQPLSHAVAASIAYGCSLHHMRLQPLSHTVAGDRPRIHTDCSLGYVRLQPLLHAVTGYRSRIHTVAAPITYGCSPCYIRLQVLGLVANEFAQPRANGWGSTLLLRPELSGEAATVCDRGCNRDIPGWGPARRWVGWRARGCDHPEMRLRSP